MPLSYCREDFREAPSWFNIRSEGRLAQLVRAPALQAGGRRFESCTAHQIGDSGRNTGDVVQLVRTLPCHGRGRGFESRRPRQILKDLLGFSESFSFYRDAHGTKMTVLPLFTASKSVIAWFRQPSRFVS